jgi:hypothetical protein
VNSAQHSTPSAALGRQLREQFVARLEGGLAALGEAVQERLYEVADAAAGTRDGQSRRETALEFEKARPAWRDAVSRAWREALVPPQATNRGLDGIGLELIGDEVVENKILASRLSLSVLEKCTWELNDLRIRLQQLEGTEELATHDILRPEKVAELLVEHSAANGLERPTWVLVQDVVQGKLVGRMLEAYSASNKLLVERGVLPEIDRSSKVKRAPSALNRSASQPVPLEAPSTDSAPGGVGQRGASSVRGNGQNGSPGAGFRGAGSGAGAGGMGNGGDWSAGMGDDTRQMTSGTPLARARMRATGVIGQLRRLLSDKAGFDPDQPAQPPAALDQAISRHATQVQTQVQTEVHAASAVMGDGAVFDNAAVERVAVGLRERSGDLKKKATTNSEKATIEIVALMFQSILAEERIPPMVRVWFARLQMPVLRVALSEPEFFGTMQHPARQLIDRMGSCVLGFDAAAINGSALEVEIKRVVQVIEQYPETGRRVFQLVYDEFQKFLSRFLTEKGDTQRLVSVAQQVEQKETMAVQYTIELRKMLDDIPVREEIREFLFKVWAEVLAVAAVKHGPQHQETIALKKSAADLVWAASAKPNKAERARVIQDLPALLQRLRQGMTLMGIQGPAQETHIKVIGDTLADAFLSKTEAIPQARIDAMAKRLANLEDFVADDPSTDLPLDADSIELMLGIDASMIEVVADGGSSPSDAMLAWAMELQIGNWFMLDHNGKTQQVQYAWRSERRQLHLFASPEGKSFLIQARRLAAYLQSGLLLPTEEEALTVRATRDALSKLDANPERLLA